MLEQVIVFIRGLEVYKPSNSRAEARKKQVEKWLPNGCSANFAEKIGNICVLHRT